MGKGKILLILFIMLLFGMAIPSLIVTGVLLLLSVDVTFGIVYGLMTLAFVVFSSPFLYKQLRKEDDLEVEDDNDDEDEGTDGGKSDVDDSECHKYM